MAESGPIMRRWRTLRRPTGGAPEAGQRTLPNPADQMAWLTTPARGERLRWFLTPWQTRIALAVCLGLAAVVLIMLFPVFPANSPAGLIYALHDSVVLPLKGRIFDRYAPVPQIACAVIVVLALAAVMGRRFATGFYTRAARAALTRERPRALLARWSRWRGSDSHLMVETERLHRDRTALYLLADVPEREDARAIVAIGLYALDQIAGLPPDRDLALSGFSAVQIASRNVCLLAASGITDGHPEQQARAVLASHGGSFGAHLCDVLDGRLPPAALERRIAEDWARTDAVEARWQGIAKDALCWIALVLARQSGDSSLLRQLLLRRSREGFERELNTKAAGEGQGDLDLLDPVFWAALTPQGAPATTQTAHGLSRPQLQALRQQLTPGQRGTAG